MGTPGAAAGVRGAAGGPPGLAAGTRGSAVGTPGVAAGVAGSAVGTPGVAAGIPGAAVGTPGAAAGVAGAAVGTPGAAAGIPGAAVASPGAAAGPRGAAAATGEVAWRGSARMRRPAEAAGKETRAARASDADDPRLAPQHLVEPGVAELLLHRVGAQALAQVAEVDASRSWSWLKQVKTTRSSPVCGSLCFCRHCAQTSFIMHCIGELMLPMARCRASSSGARTPCRASRTAFIIRSVPMAMMRSTSRELDDGLAELAPRRRPASPGRCCRGTGGPAGGAARSRARVGAPDDLIGVALDVVALEEVLAAPVAGEVEDACRPAP